MVKRFLIRLTYGLLFALPLMVLTYAIALASAQEPNGDTAGQTTLDCKSCHPRFHENWENSAHKNGFSNPVFQAAFQEQGEPGSCLTCHVTGYDPVTETWEEDGITCQACHSPVPENHPKAPMPAERSSKLCGECHEETFFEWQASEHRQQGLDCVGCHSAHTTDMKAKDPAAQCATCHRQRSSNYAHSRHAAEGLTCADCHLATLEDPAQEGHARMDHSFTVRLSTCNQCHAYEMHDPADVHPENPTPVPADALAAVEHPVSTEPNPVNPLGFASLSGLIGLAAGALIAPWLDRIFRKRC